MRFYILLIFFIVTSCSQAGSSWIDRSKHKGLSPIKHSHSFEVYATEANPQNIANTLSNLGQAKDYFDGVFDEDLKFAVLFVDNQNWDSYAFAPPPGMPQSFKTGGNMVLGLQNSVMASRWKQQLAQLQEIESDSLAYYFGDEIDLDLFFRDALSLHELGHLYQFFRTSDISQRRWLEEIFGNLCQVAAAENLNSRHVLQGMDYFQMLLIEKNLWGEVKFTTIDQFESSYFDIINQGRNYGWYQTQFYLIAKDLYSEYGDTFLDTFRDFLIAIDPEEVGVLSDFELNKIMNQTFGKETVDILKWKH